MRETGSTAGSRPASDGKGTMGGGGGMNGGPNSVTDDRGDTMSVSSDRLCASSEGHVRFVNSTIRSEPHFLKNMA